MKNPDFRPGVRSRRVREVGRRRRAGEYGVGPVAVAALEVVAAQPAIVLEVADHRLDCRASPELFLDGRRDAALLARSVDFELIR